MGHLANVLDVRDEVCNNETVGTRLMCPDCSTWCDFRQLNQSCSLYKFSYVFDNDLTVVFAFVMSVWGELIVNTS